MRQLTYIAVSLAIFFGLVACSKSNDTELKATIDVNNTRIASLDSDVEAIAAPTTAVEASTTSIVQSPVPIIKPSHAPTQIRQTATNAIAVATQTSTPSAMVKAIATDDGKVFLGDILLLDVSTDGPGCFEVEPTISYSPNEEHFLVNFHCFEGDNTAFLFRADGSDKLSITGQYDFMNYGTHEWADDGKSFTYERINSCCLGTNEIPAWAPPQGLVRYDVDSGEKTLVSNASQATHRVVGVAANDVLNVRAGPGVDNPIVGIIPYDGAGILITGQGILVESRLWVPVAFEGVSGWVNSKYLELQSIVP